MNNTLQQPGDSLIHLLTTNRGDVLLVSPFIKRAALERALESIEPEVPISCVTRWVLEELVAGVSDIDIFQTLSSRGNATIHLRQNLHAKYFRRGERCLIGSANLTLSGMGWKPLSNLEILVEQDCNNPSLRSFESEVFRGSVSVNESMYLEYLALLNEIEASPKLELPPWLDQSLPPSPHSFENWLPTARNPENLFVAYSGKLDDLHSSARLTALQDLEVLSPLPGLEEQVFNRTIGQLLLQFPLLQALDELAASAGRFGAFRDFLQDRLPERNANDAWQTTMRWLLYFRSDRYEMFTPRHSEIFRRRL